MSAEVSRLQRAPFAGLLPATLQEHPAWPEIAERSGVEHGVVLQTGKRHRPIEFRTGGLSLGEVEEFARIRIACAVCRCAIHPIRRRSRNKAGRLEVLKTCFIALTCPLHESPGCSRSKPASLATAALCEAIARRQAGSTETGPPPPAPKRTPQPSTPQRPQAPTQLGLKGFLS